jgi:hypothetical protein
MDSDDPARALELLVPEFRFHIALPGREATGRSKDDFAAYISGRNAVERVHKILRHSCDGDLEAVVTPDGHMARYQSYFTTTYDLIDLPE